MGNAAMYEARPVGGGGDNPLYAQTLSTDPTYSSSLGAAHVGKRRPYLDETQGMKDFRLTKVGVGSNGPGTLSATPTASLPPLPYSSNLETKFTGKETKTRPSDDPAKLGGIMPGYTGYVHGRQHVYGTSYGHVSRKLTQDGDANETMTQRSGRLVGYAESKPHGPGRPERGKLPPRGLDLHRVPRAQLRLEERVFQVQATQSRRRGGGGGRRRRFGRLRRRRAGELSVGRLDVQQLPRAQLRVSRRVLQVQLEAVLNPDPPRRFPRSRARTPSREGTSIATRNDYENT